jgi:hypothetical protein
MKMPGLGIFMLTVNQGRGAQTHLHDCFYTLCHFKSIMILSLYVSVAVRSLLSLPFHTSPEHTDAAQLSSSRAATKLCTLHPRGGLGLYPVVGHTQQLPMGDHGGCDSNLTLTQQGAVRP